MYALSHRVASLGTQCFVSLPTIQTVSSCPKNEAELSRAIQRKHCEHLAILQRCTPPENFKYHCVLNTWKNETVEVCAQVISSQGYCLYFDEGGARLQEIYERDCTNYTQPCHTRFLSSNLSNYSQCNDIIRKTENFMNMTKTTKRLLNKLENTNDEIIKYSTIIIGFAVFLALHSIVVGYEFIRKLKGKRHRNEKKSLNVKDPHDTENLIQEADGDNTQVLFEAMGKYANAKLICTLKEHDIFCVETFCTLTEADYTAMKLSIGQRRNCSLAVKQIRENYGLRLPGQINEAENNELLLPSQNEETLN